MPTRTIRACSVGAALTSLVLASGCGACDRAGAAELNDLTAGFATFEQSRDRDALIRRREDAVVQCMQSVFGLTYLAVPPDTTPPTQETSDTYGLVDQYTGTPAPSEPSAADPNEAMLADLDPAAAEAWRQAAFGTDREFRDRNPSSTDARRVGCINAASAVVLGPENAQVLVEFAEAQQQIASDTDADAALARAVAGHAECMADAGFGAAGAAAFDPAGAMFAEAQRRIPALVDQPIDVVADQLGPDAAVVDQLREYERSMRQADDRCATQLKLDAVRDQAERRATDRYASSHANRIEHFRSVLADVRHRARTATQSSGRVWDRTTFTDGGGRS